MPAVVLRADAYPEIGTGHLMRMLALGQALADEGAGVIFITYCTSAGLVDRLRLEGFELHLLDAPYPESSPSMISILLEKYPGAWVVLDGVQFDGRAVKMIKDAGRRVLLFDDMAANGPYEADIVVNQNLHAHDLVYECAGATALLLGSRYVILRREFAKYRNRPVVRNQEIDTPARAKNVIAALGGADPQNLTLKALQAVLDVPDIAITAVVGAGNPNLQSILKLASDAGGRLRVLHDVREMSAVMAAADMAVSSGGTTVWELCFMGLPAVVGRIAPIEDYLINGLNRRGIFTDAGWYSDASRADISRAVESMAADAGLRLKMSQTARQVVDGLGAGRVLKAMRDAEAGRVV
jgi:UDP-2,4-diacetamido-2,4,6-trideoxy-beta-L-altropyranose hydrolase